MKIILCKIGIHYYQEIGFKKVSGLVGTSLPFPPVETLIRMKVKCNRCGKQKFVGYKIININMDSFIRENYSNLQDLFKCHPNYFDFGHVVRTKYSSSKFIKDHPNDYDLAETIQCQLKKKEA